MTYISFIRVNRYNNRVATHYKLHVQVHRSQRTPPDIAASFIFNQCTPLYTSGIGGVLFNFIILITTTYYPIPEITHYGVKSAYTV